MRGSPYTLALKPEIYQLWFGKQGSDHCGMGKMLKRWDESANSRCPNWGMLNKDAGHLNRCTNNDRWLMLIKSIKEIKEWIIKNSTYPKFIEWVPQYLSRQGKAKCVELGNMSPMMRCVGVAQDNIRWRDFIEGKITESMRNLQELWLLSEPACLTIDAWMRGLIEKLLTLTHSQWIFRNITKHHHTNRTIKLEAKQDVM